MKGTWRQRILQVLCALSLTGTGIADPARAGDPQVGDGGTGAFYQWTAPVPAGSPQIVRRAPLEPGKTLAEAAVGDRILNTGHGGPDGNTPIVVSGSVYLPRGHAPKGGWPVIAWAHGTVGFPDICAPSFNGWAERDAGYLNNWLKQGYAIVASDYEGLGTDGPHAYMMSKSAAESVLESVVAARASYPLSRRIVIVGQSQGAHAAASAALLQPKLAPSLRLMGVVLTGWPGSMALPTALKMDAFDPMAMLYLRYLPSYAVIDPGFRPEALLTPAGRALYEGFRSSCGSAAAAAFLAQKPVTNTLFMRDPSPLEARAEPFRAYPPLAFKAPVFLGIGLDDMQTSPKAAFDGAKRACALGSDIAIHLYPGLGHSPTMLRSQEDSMPWVRAAFAGKAPPGDCATATFPGG